MSSIFHICKSLNRTFTFEEWCDYCNNHRDRDEIVFRYCGFGFNICDVCLTPHIKVKWQGKAHNSFMIETGTVISCTSKVANIKVALKEIEKYKEIYNPKQLTLFDL